MKQIHIAIIDDGVNERYFNTSLIYNLEVTEDLEIINRIDYNKEKKNHATTCAGIIKKYVSCNIQLSSIKVLSKYGDGKLNKLLTAMEWCIENDIDIINLSMGTVCYQDKKSIKDVIYKAFKKGIIIIAANKNDRIITYPAVFMNTIGVKCSITNDLEEGEYIYNHESEDGVHIIACGSHMLKNHLSIEKKVQNCNSFATPMITAFVADYLATNPNADLNSIKEYLYKSSINYNNQKYYQTYLELDWIENPIIFTSNNIIKPSYFNAVDIININHLENDQIVPYILGYLSTIKSRLIKIDSIIFDLYNCNINIDDIEEFIKYVISINKKPIILNHNKDDKVIKNILKNANNPVYFNNIDIPLNVNKREEMPLIIIKDSNLDLVLNVLVELGKLFEKNGYNPTIFTNSMYGLFYDFRQIDEKNRDNINNINSMIDFYNGDIGIIGIAAKDNVLYELDAMLDIDVYILNQNDKTYKEYYKKMARGDKEMLVLKFPSDNQIKEYANMIYEQIVDFYDTEEIIV